MYSGVERRPNQVTSRDLSISHALSLHVVWPKSETPQSHPNPSHQSTADLPRSFGRRHDRAIILFHLPLNHLPTHTINHIGLSSLSSISEPSSGTFPIYRALSLWFLSLDHIWNPLRHYFNTDLLRLIYSPSIHTCSRLSFSQVSYLQLNLLFGSNPFHSCRYHALLLRCCKIHSTQDLAYA
jgi:hypothetical protein